ncbi:hypothetical protein [Sediminibacillus sp. JSM 1682029]|uniref:hypothetical protein n=1 Tax=Sediminibacillus sp. JSM 1682029 TaxID=3229857 RepID=UPI0035246F9A
METKYQEIIEWLKQRPLWLQDAANKVISNGNLSQEDLNQVVANCKAEEGIGETKEIKGVERSINLNEEKLDLFLESISDTQNINALSSREPLDFVIQICLSFMDQMVRVNQVTQGY